MRLAGEELLALHRELVATPSISGDETAIVERLARFLAAHGAAVERIGGSLLAWAGADPAAAPLVVFDTHVDTVPPAPGWSADPFVPRCAEGRVIGLGANDAKASVATMVAALVLADQRGLVGLHHPWGLADRLNPAVRLGPGLLRDRQDPEVRRGRDRPSDLEAPEGPACSIAHGSQEGGKRRPDPPAGRRHCSG